MIKLLLESGRCDPNIVSEHSLQDEEICTPLHTAIDNLAVAQQEGDQNKISCFEEIITLLKEYGAISKLRIRAQSFSSDERIDSPSTPLSFFKKSCDASKSSPSLVEALEQETERQHFTTEFRSRLSVATIKGRPAVDNLKHSARIKRTDSFREHLTKSSSLLPLSDSDEYCYDTSSSSGSPTM